MKRAAALALYLAALLAVPASTAHGSGDTTVDIARLLSPRFGYATVLDYGPPFASRLDLYEDGRWHDATPPHLVGVIEDVSFIDRRHGWVVSFDCGRFRMHLYRTTDGGRSWHASEPQAWHSCGGGPTFLGFADTSHGWLEPVSPNGPGGDLLSTADGGRTWKQVAQGLGEHSGTPGTLACLGPIFFESATRGWQGACRLPTRTKDGGRIWRPMRLHGANRGLSVAGIPLSFGRRVVVALSLEARWLGPVRAVEIAVSHDAGHSFAVEALRPVGWCPNEGGLHGLFAPPRAAIVGPTTWWIFGAVGGRPTLEITGDAGRTWHSEHPSRLPPWPCSLVAVSVAGPRDALGLVAATPEDSQRGRYFLMATHDGGDSWRPVRLP